jgi:hypothetical protein
MQVVGYAVLGAIGIFLLVGIFRRTKDHLLQGDRLYDKKEDFLQYFEERDLSADLALSVYVYVSDWMGREFPVRPSDNIAEIYGIVDEDLDDFVLAIAKTGNLVVPTDTSYWQNPVVTIEDLVRFVSSFAHDRA